LKIHAKIIDLKNNREIDVSKEGSNRVWTLLQFMGTAKKYAKEGYKILKVETDDLTTYSELTQNYPKMLVVLTEKNSEVEG
jgi:DNA polymerase elongation subunit (family B)